MTRAPIALLTLICILLFGLVMLFALNQIPCQQAAMKECSYTWDDGRRIKTCLERRKEDL